MVLGQTDGGDVGRDVWWHLGDGRDGAAVVNKDDLSFGGKEVEGEYALDALV